MKNCYLTTLLALAICWSVNAQISFTYSNDRLPNPSAKSGVAIAVLDINGDGLDDIAHLDNGRQLYIEYQKSDGSGFTSVYAGQVSNESQWAICAGDVDNNGIVDILTGGSYDDVKLMMANDDGSEFTTSYLPGPGLFVQATNLADINNDGHLDFFSCHDDAESRIWGNDGTGNLFMADDWIDMATDPGSDNSGNYGSVWTDIDNDGDLDLYIAKCRQGVNSPSDPRRINALFLNDGNNNYTEAADSANLKIGAQSWTADFQDIDNDGDMDCFITNHDTYSMLLENDGTGVFTDISAGSGINVNGLPIQGVMRDFDNDGFVDIIVAGSQHHLFHNNGDRTFTEINDVFDNNDMESYGLGDLNHDGYIDIYAGYANIYTNPSNIDDVLWINEGGDNNFLTVNLIGTESNRSGVGARLEIYGEWGIQIREVRAGESYGITNSLAQHFGLGEADMIDSLIIRWPSGVVDQYNELVANQFISVIENTCISPVATLEVVGETTICSGETVNLTAPEGFEYNWSNGATEQSIAVGEAGAYSVTISDGTACFGTSQSVTVIVDPDETPSLSYAGDTVFCAGGSVTLLSSEAESYLWSTGETSSSIEVTEAGAYTVDAEGLCGTFTSEPLSVNVLAAPSPNLDDIIFGESDVTIQASGDNISWYDEAVGGSAFAFGNEVIVPVNGDTSFTYYAESRTLYPGGSFEVGMVDHSGSAFSGNIYNGGLIFDAISAFTLRSVKVYTDTEGPRIIELQTEEGDVLQSLTVNIPVGETVIDINFFIEAGTNYFLTTNTQNNSETFGYNSPRLYRSNDGVNFPYSVEGIVNINDTNFGNSRYYYWFDWKIKEPDYNCISERVEIEVNFVDTDEVVAALEAVRINPNPTSGQIQLQLPEQLSNSNLRLLDVSGKLIRTYIVQSLQPELDMTDLPDGLYFLEIEADGQRIMKKVVKQ